MLTPELQARLEELTQKTIAGTITREELAEAVRIMREGRVGAAAASTKARAKRAPIDSNALLDSF